MAEETHVRDFLKKNFLFSGDVRLGDEDSFMENGVLDSTGVLELIAFLESTFGITVEDDELLPDNLDSIARVATFVRRKRAAAGAGTAAAG